MIYLIDPYGHSDTGHFWYVTNTFIKALNELKLDFIFVSPSCEEMEIQLSANTQSRCVGYKFFPVEPGTNDNLFAELVHELKEKDDKAVLIFTWLPFRSRYDYTLFFEDLKNCDVSIVGVSNLTSESVVNYNEDYVFEFEELFNNYQICKIIWVWHEPRFGYGASYKIRRLPEFHPSIPSLEKDSFEIRTSKSLNFFGGLNGYRGLSEFFILALLNPNVKFKAKGYSYSSLKLWKPCKFSWMRYKSWKDKPWIAIPSIFISLLLSTLRFLPNLKFHKRQNNCACLIDQTNCFWF